MVDATGRILHIILEELQYSIWSDDRAMEGNCHMMDITTLVQVLLESLCQSLNVERLSHA